MRVLFTSTPASGHLTPLLRYAHALQERGHQVLFAASEKARAALGKAGLDLAPVADPTAEERAPVFARLDAATGEEAMIVGLRELFAGILAKAALPGLLDIVEDWRPQLIVRESMEFAGLVAAEKAGLRSARVSVLACRTHEHFLEAIREPIDEIRDLVGLSPVHGATWEAESVFSAFPHSIDSLDTMDGRPKPLLVGPSCGTQTPMTGTERWLPRDGAPLVYITFGTVAGRSDKSRAAYRRALDAVATLPVRALLTTGPVMDAGLLGTIPDNVTVETYVPQDAVFAHASAVVDHGGSGTFLGALAAGLPQVVVPLFADQPHNARSLDASGAGIAVFDTETTGLRSAIERVLVDDDIRGAAKKVAVEMAAMPDIQDAVEELLFWQRHDGLAAA